jgi:hypothetical protein
VHLRHAFALLALIALPAAAHADITYYVYLDRSQEVSSPCDPGLTGFGNATVVINTTTNIISYNLAYTGLSSAVTAAHFHGPASTSQNAPVIFGLNTANNPMVGTVGPATATHLTQIANGQWYLNVHTGGCPSGEIRGQLTAPVPARKATWGALKQIYR